jgi:predicted ATPase
MAPDKTSHFQVSELTVSNFRSLGQDVRVQLNRLTALVGPNGSGKSSVTEVFRLVADAFRVGLEAAITTRHGIPAVRRWSAGRPFDLSIRLELTRSDATALYEFVLGDRKAGYRVKREAASITTEAGVTAYEVSEGRWTSGPSDLRPSVTDVGLVLPLIAGDARFRPLADALKSIEVYSIFPDTLREPQKPDPTRPMQRHGANWCSVLKEMREDQWAPDLRAALGRLTGDIDDIRVKQIGGFLVAEFRHVHEPEAEGNRREKWFDAAQESDGTLRFAGILSALLQEPPLTLMGIEEPELTVHSGALPLLFDHLVQASTRGQVVITTHSPELLDFFDADDVRVVERVDGVTNVAPMEESQRHVVRQKLFSLGELVRMEGLRAERPVAVSEMPPTDQGSLEF